MDRIFYYVQKELYMKNGTFMWPVTILAQACPG